MRLATVWSLVWLALSLPLAAQTLPAGQTGGPNPPGSTVQRPGDASPDAGGGAKPVQKKNKRPPRVSTPPGSGETHAERTARLRRECKGMPNAGACTGMTH